MRRNQRRIEAIGHRYRFAVAHGPLTIASYLVGHTEFMLGIRLAPENIRGLPPRDVLGALSPQRIATWMRAHLTNLDASGPLIVGASGFLPPGADEATLDAVAASAM